MSRWPWGCSVAWSCAQSHQPHTPPRVAAEFGWPEKSPVPGQLHMTPATSCWWPAGTSPQSQHLLALLCSRFIRVQALASLLPSGCSVYCCNQNACKANSSRWHSLWSHMLYHLPFMTGGERTKNNTTTSSVSFASRMRGKEIWTFVYWSEMTISPEQEQN